MADSGPPAFILLPPDQWPPPSQWPAPTDHKGSNVFPPPPPPPPGAPPPPPPVFDPNLPMPPFPISPHAAELARIYYGATCALLVFVVIAFTMRMYQRMRPVWKVGADDYFIMAGFVLSVTDWGMLTPMMFVKPSWIPWEDVLHGTKHSWLAIGIWGLSMSCIKISIALTLLRIQQKERAWRIFLYSIIVIQVLYGILNELFNTVLACRPLEGAWNIMVPNRWCVEQNIMTLVSNIGSAVNISTDILLSLAPGVFLRKLNRPLRERIFVCVLMGLGLFASVSSIVKTVIVQHWTPGNMEVDFWAQGVAISTYTVLEQFTGLLAACVPAMKGIFQACLGKVGVSLTDSRSRPGRSGYNRSGGTGGLGSNPFGSHNAIGSHVGSRYARGGKEDSIDEDEEKCLEMPEMRRGVSTPKSSTGSGSFHHGVGAGEYKNGGIVTVEQVHMPAHAV